MKRIVTTILICSLIAGDVLAVDRKKAAYVAGTIESLNKLRKASEGELDLKNENALVFNVNGLNHETPYDRITALEYQLSPRPRAAMASGAIGASVLSVVAAGATAGVSLVALPVTLVAIPFLKKRRRRHFLTVAYEDADDKPQALVLELGKDIEKEARAVIAARSGKEIRVTIEEN